MRCAPNGTNSAADGKLGNFANASCETWQC